eukprot:Skav226492  [mRNA]  locus=scaffold744:226269:229293:- [translate_table: standard]
MANAKLWLRSCALLLLAIVATWAPSNFLIPSKTPVLSPPPNRDEGGWGTDLLVEDESLLPFAVGATNSGGSAMAIRCCRGTILPSLHLLAASASEKNQASAISPLM